PPQPWRNLLLNFSHRRFPSFFRKLRRRSALPSRLRSPATKPPLLRRCGRAPPSGETPHRFALAQAPYPPAVAAPPPRPGEFELDTSYIRLRAVRVLHPARHPPERPRVGSWPSDVKAGAGRNTRTVVECCGRTSGTARRRLGLRKRETVSARSSIC